MGDVINNMPADVTSQKISCNLLEALWTWKSKSIRYNAPSQGESQQVTTDPADRRVSHRTHPSTHLNVYVIVTVHCISIK